MNNLTNERLNELSTMRGACCGILEEAIKETAEMAREILSLRAQLAEMRGQEPIGYVAKDAVIRIREERSRFCSLFATASGRSVIPVYPDPVPPAASQPGPAQPSIPVWIRQAIQANGVAEILNDARKYDFRLSADQWKTLVNNWYQTFLGLSEGFKESEASQPDTPPVEAPYGYFAFWHEYGVEFFNKREDAIAFCKEAIDDYRRENADEGCDDREVTRTCWGVIMQKGAVIGVGDYGHIDFALTDELNACRAAMLQSGGKS
ncbi:hypothetical protein [Pectobacterium odoriferum]|uniref:hypothetical protein n=1 Tax=Pectobacterium odoriferum TaxID=78398 RepID=UPI001CF2F45A|nr:hypothetical protein [Pectobacterium odoriferum]MCA6962457.1 hypothetical protein [Pectobacterium odoriferum]MCH5010553.1 hypothetical protein [Pectobacterium odoriferum]